MSDNLTTSFAVIFVTNFFTYRTIGNLQTSFYNIHGIKAVKNQGGDTSFVNSALKPP